MFCYDSLKYPVRVFITQWYAETRIVLEIWQRFCC